MEMHGCGQVSIKPYLKSGDGWTWPASCVVCQPLFFCPSFSRNFTTSHFCDLCRSKASDGQFVLIAYCDCTHLLCKQPGPGVPMLGSHSQELLIHLRPAQGSPQREFQGCIFHAYVNGVCHCLSCRGMVEWGAYKRSISILISILYTSGSQPQRTFGNVGRHLGSSEWGKALLASSRW